MASDANGILQVPIWSDNGVAKPLINDDGRVPVKVEESSVTQDVNIVSSDIDVPVSLDAATIDVPISIDAQTVTVEVEEQSPLTEIQAQAYGWDLTVWRKLAMLWGYTDRYVYDLSGTATAVYYWATTPVVAAGYIFVVQGVYIRNNSKAGTSQVIQFQAGGVVYHFGAYGVLIAQYIPTTYNGEIALAAGDRVYVSCNLCTIGDAIQAGVWGYRMKINE